MEIQLVNNKQEWNGWLEKQNSFISFTQSFEWGEILVSEGKQIARVAVIFEGETIAQALLVFSKIAGFQYAFCPKGPVFKTEASEQEREAMQYIASYVREQGGIFLRVETFSLQSLVGHEHYKSIDINPRATTVLNLVYSIEELLLKMHPKTRYNIRLSEKKGIVVESKKDLRVFWDLMQKTGKRDDFKLHDKKHYEAILNSPLTFQFTAYLNDRPIAANFFVKFGRTLTYLFGASDYEHRNLMAPYRLQWEGIKFGKESGCNTFDFFGIAPQLGNGSNYDFDPKHQYAGVTRFKLGFGGTVQELPGTYDLIISPLRYKVYGALRTLRRLI